jgi:hypothetical protein
MQKIYRLNINYVTPKILNINSTNKHSTFPTDRTQLLRSAVSDILVECLTKRVDDASQPEVSLCMGGCELF